MSRALPARADTVVIGAGTAGALVAHRLAARADREVLLLEQGPGTLPGEVAALSRLPLTDRDRVQQWPERRGRPVLRGRGLGGSAAINGGYFLRGRPGDYAHWPEWWTPERIAAGFAEVERLLQVTAFADDELGDVARAFEQYWAGRPGLRRVRSNRRHGHRFTAAQVLHAAADGGPTVLGRAHVEAVLCAGGRVHGVRVRGREVLAGEVIVAAGTLGTAALLRRSGVLAAMGLDRLRPHEHPERLVRWQPVRPVAAPALLQSVMQLDGTGGPEGTGGAGEPGDVRGPAGTDGVEIRCYGDDFARFTGGRGSRDEPAGVPVGVADLAHPAVGTLDEGGLDLGEPDEASSARMARGVAAVVQMVESSSYADLVVPGSVRIDPVTSMSQHATGTLPLGRVVDEFGGVRQISGLRVVDGSIIPGALSAGPHASIAMAAWLIGGAIT